MSPVIRKPASKSAEQKDDNPVPDAIEDLQERPAKRRRGRPKGSKNKPKPVSGDAPPTSAAKVTTTKSGKRRGRPPKNAAGPSTPKKPDSSPGPVNAVKKAKESPDDEGYEDVGSDVDELEPPPPKRVRPSETKG